MKISTEHRYFKRKIINLNREPNSELSEFQANVQAIAPFTYKY